VNLQEAAAVMQPQPQLIQQQEEPQQQATKKKKVSEFINRVIFGILLGFGGAAVVAKGSLLYLCATMFVVYHATQEFYGFLTSSGISQGMPPPSKFVSVATTALCLSITVFTYFRCVVWQGTGALVCFDSSGSSCSMHHFLHALCSACACQRTLAAT
jgi:hypothetical protein